MFSHQQAADSVRPLTIGHAAVVAMGADWRHLLHASPWVYSHYWQDPLLLMSSSSTCRAHSSHTRGSYANGDWSEWGGHDVLQLLAGPRLCCLLLSCSCTPATGHATFIAGGRGRLWRATLLRQREVAAS